jgi:hypothetical protein
VSRRPRSWLDPAGHDPETGAELRVADLVRRGEQILGTRHNAERAAEWREWWQKLSEEQRGLYNRAQGKKPRKSD